MGRLPIATFLACAMAAAPCAPARAPEHDLDRPGALEALQAANPRHFAKVMEEIGKAQEIHVDPRPVLQRAHTGPADPRRVGATAILPTNPAMKRLVIAIDDVRYRVTAYLTRRPGRLEPAR